MENDAKQSWEGCEHAKKCYETLTDYYVCINKRILDLNSFPTILLMRGGNSFVTSAVLFNHTYTSFEDRVNAEKSETLERTLQREMDKRLSICKVCKLYEPKAKSKRLEFYKNLQIVNKH